MQPAESVPVAPSTAGLIVGAGAATHDKAQTATETAQSATCLPDLGFITNLPTRLPALAVW